MSTTYLAVGVAFAFLILLWIAVGVRHLRLLRRNLDGSWEFVDEKIRKRHDVVPLLIEIIGRRDGVGELVDKVVKVRDEARRIYFASGDKTEKEYDLSKAIDELVKMGTASGTVSRDTYFLELKEELEGLSSDIENRAGEYNEVVRKFNKHRKIFLLRPVALVLRGKQALIFEFEK